MTEYLTKPLDKKALLTMVHRCATTLAVLHPNLNKIIDVTPGAESGNPLDSTSWDTGSPREPWHNQSGTQRPASRGNLVRASSSSD